MVFSKVQVTFRYKITLEINIVFNKLNLIFVPLNIYIESPQYLQRNQLLLMCS